MFYHRMEDNLAEVQEMEDEELCDKLGIIKEELQAYKDGTKSIEALMHQNLMKSLVQTF